jgi:hypothetical protein
MVAAVLDALVGGEPSDEVVAQALTTIPAAELPEALRLLARQHGAAALPVLRCCLHGRVEWASAAAAALATVVTPEAAAALAAAEATTTSKAARTAFRRALYRLRQAGVMPPRAPAAPPTPPRPVLRDAWASAVDGTGSRGLWLVLEGRYGERTLLSAIVNDEGGVLDFASEAMGKRRLDEHLRALAAESPLPLVAVPPTWAVHLLVQASAQPQPTEDRPSPELARWLAVLPLPVSPAPPIYAHLPADALAADRTLLDGAAELLGTPELGGWFLDPPSIQTEALELLQARESRLVVSDQIKAEREAAIVDRVIDSRFGPEARQRWQRRLEETAFVFWETGRPAEARRAAATAVALADGERLARHIPFVRALVERSLEIAGEVTLGRLSPAEVSRAPRLSPPPA